MLDGSGRVCIPLHCAPPHLGPASELAGAGGKHQCWERLGPRLPGSHPLLSVSDNTCPIPMPSSDKTITYHQESNYLRSLGAKQQQVTTYAHKDENNFFVIKKWNEEPPNNTDPDAIIDFVKNGDLVRLEHLTSRRNIHSHREPAPVSKRHFPVCKI